MTADLRTVDTLAKGRRDDLSLRTMRSSSGTYSWLAEEREGTEKEKPWPDRMEWVRRRIRVSIVD